MMTIERKARVCLNKNSLTLHMLCLEYTDVNTPNRAQWTFDVWADGRLLPLQIIGFQDKYEINGCIRNAGGSRSICWAHVFPWKKTKQNTDSTLFNASNCTRSVHFQTFAFTLIKTITNTTLCLQEIWSTCELWSSDHVKGIVQVSNSNI